MTREERDATAPSESPDSGDAAAETPNGQAGEEAPGNTRGPRRARGGRTAAVEEMKRALDERENQYRRLAADFENHRRRSAQELLDRARYGGEDAARELLPVLDNLRRAIDHIPDGGPEDQLRNGLTLVVREFEAALERIGLSPIEAVGSPFDPALHNAIGGEDSDEYETETVIDELQRGYRLHDRVIRPAMVRIARPTTG